MDANVKRVLTRVLAFEGDLAQARQEKILWELAEQLLPQDSADMPRYTQGLMDLGASICLARSPSCLLCPLQAQCRAAQQGRAQEFPVKTRTTQRRSQSWWLLFVRDAQQRYWLQRRPAQGGANAIWAGLYSPLVCASAQQLQAHIAPWGKAQRSDLPVRQHILTHRELFLHPVLLQVEDGSVLPAPSDEAQVGQWWTLEQALQQGLPAPVRKLLADL